MSIMPSRRIVAVGLILCVATGLIWWFNKPEKSSAPNSQGETGQSLFENYPQLQSFSVSPTTTAVIADSLLENKELSEFSWANGPKPYTSASLKIVGDDPQTLRSYGLAIADALKPLSVERNNETEILISAFDSGDYAELAKIKSAQTIFENLKTNLLRMSVPKVASERHLVVLNGAQNMAWLLKNMGQLSFQPVLAMESGRVYLEESRGFFLAIGLLGKLFNEQKIVFSPAEKITIYVNVE